MKLYVKLRKIQDQSLKALVSAEMNKIKKKKKNKFSLRLYC